MLILLDTLVAFIVLVLAWRQWKKTARGAVRDKIFDLRDELRNYYVENGLDMRDGAYERTRNLLNRLLRYTKSMRMIGYIYFSSHIDKEMVDSASAEFDAVIQKCDKNAVDLITRIRRQACQAIFLYMAATSLGFISAALMMFVYAMPTKIISVFKKSLNSICEFNTSTLEYAAMR